jgi:FkbM family methyltransferase
MNKSDKLNQVFNNKLMRAFIPLINSFITYLNNGSRVTTRYDNLQKNWVHTENSTILSIDKSPCWNISYKTMEKAAKAICCKNYLPKTGDVVVDLGAGVGFETVLFQKLVGEAGKVFAVEAHPETASLLGLLCSKNNFKNVVVSQTAIGGSIGTVYIEDRNNHDANSIRGNRADGIEVSLMTFDQFVRENEIKRINYLKINIEGAEEDAIQGMEESIKIVENLAVSCHDFLETIPSDRIKNNLIKFLVKNNFEVEESNDEHIVRRSWIYANNKSLR